MFRFVAVCEFGFRFLVVGSFKGWEVLLRLWLRCIYVYLSPCWRILFAVQVLAMNADDLPWGLIG